MSYDLVVLPGLCFVGCLDSICMGFHIGCGEPRYLYAVMHCIPFCSIVYYVTFASSFPFQLRSCKDKTRISLSTYLAHVYI